MIKYSNFILPIVCSILIITSCSATRTGIDGLYSVQNKFEAKKPVKVLFDIFYYTHEIGRDAIPKSRSYSGIPDFNDIFKKSIREVTNIDEYETFYNSSDLINNHEKRNEKESKIEKSDYVIKLEILKENSFSKHVLGAIITMLSMDLIPVSYTWKYIMTATIINKDGEVVSKYLRSASVTNRFQIFLLALYPFHPMEAKTEEIYLECLANIFMQIENENVLK